MLIRRLSLKSKKLDGKIYTTQAWIDEYVEFKRSKDHHSIFNGRKVFDSEKGELSVTMVASELGIARCTVIYHIKTGSLKSFCKGKYYVIRREDLDAFKARNDNMQEICANA